MEDRTPPPRDAQARPKPEQGTVWGFIPDQAPRTFYYVYGPFLLSLGLTFFLATQDAAFEAIIAVFDGLLRFDLVGIANAVFAVLGFVALPVVLWHAVLCGLYAKHLRDRQTAFNFQARPENPPPFWQDVRQRLRAATKTQPASMVERTAVVWISRLPFAGGVLGLIRILRSPEVDWNSPAGLQAIAAAVICAAIFASGIWAYRQVEELPDGGNNRDLIVKGVVAFCGFLRRRVGWLFRVGRKIANLLPARNGWFLDMWIAGRDWCVRQLNRFHVITLIIFVVIAAYPMGGILLGPVAVTLVFICVLSFVFGLFNIFFVAPRTLGLPLVLVPLVLGYMSNGTYNFMLMAVIGTGIVVYFSLRQQTAHLPAYAGLLLIGAPLVYGAIFLNLSECRAFSGCNIVAVDDGARKPELATVGDAFAAWDATDPDREVIRVVAAQGGGLFAAYHAAMHLAHMSDTRPGYADSIFAISGVSGGAVGGSVYWAVRASGVCNDAIVSLDNTCHVDHVREILRNDYLSPALAGLLTRDFLESIVAFSSFSDVPLDRGYILHTRLRDLTDRSLPQEDMPLIARPLHASWDADGGMPLLFLNGTDVQCGTRRVFSPISNFTPIDERNRSCGTRAIPVNAINKDSDGVSVGEAAVMSARFPIVTPPARLNVGRGEAARQQQIVDGGYFDNTGLETVNDILLELPMDRRNVQVVTFETRLDNLTAGPNKGLVGAPLGALLAVASARVSTSRARFQQHWLPRNTTLNIKPDVLDFVDRRLKANFTLSWLLNNLTFCVIETEVTGRELDGCDGTSQ